MFLPSLSVTHLLFFSTLLQVPTVVFLYPPTPPTGRDMNLQQRQALPGLPTRRWWIRASCGSSVATSSMPQTITWWKRKCPNLTSRWQVVPFFLPLSPYSALYPSHLFRMLLGLADKLHKKNLDDIFFYCKGCNSALVLVMWPMSESKLMKVKDINAATRWPAVHPINLTHFTIWGRSLGKLC